MILNLHAVVPVSRANGPGRRFTAWFQGCSNGCAGCFNPVTHSFEKRLLIDSHDLVAQMADTKGVEGLSISGGEPFEQAEGLHDLLQQVRKESQRGGLPPGFSILIFSGLTLARIKTLQHGHDILQLIDVLVDGPYDQKKASPPGSFVSSCNQTIHLLTEHYVMSDFSILPKAEVIIGADGSLVCTGVHPFLSLVADSAAKDEFKNSTQV